MSTRTTRLKEIIEQNLAPTSFSLRDESHLHAGHNPEAAKGETHYKMEITSDKFNGLSRIQQHRLVMDLLQTELESGLHALALITRATR